VPKNGNIHPTRIFKDASQLLAAWNDYKIHRDNEAKKWAKVQYVGRDGNRVTDNPPMPYDLDGFFSWYYLKKGKHIYQYFKNTEAYGDDFLPIVTHIIAERNDSIKTGTLLGFFNSSMGNRIVGLVDKQEVDANVKVNTINANFGTAIQSTPGAGADTQ
jgi:hypothetical protein